MDPVIIDRYVRAIFNAAQQVAEEKVVENDLVSLTHEMRRSGLKTFFGNPHYPLAVKLRVVDKIGVMLSSRLSRNFLRLLLEHSRIGLLEHITDRYTELHREAMGIVACDVVFSAPPSAGFLARVEEELKRITHLNVEIRVVVNPEILGGVRLRIKNYVLDGTYRKRLEFIKDRLLDGQYA